MANSITDVEKHFPDLSKHFECPVCYEWARPPIYQCARGHIVCSTCRPQVTNCPTCRDPMGNIRNLALENLLSTVKFPCTYASKGCEVVDVFSSMEEHLELCGYRTINCPFPGNACSWNGTIYMLGPHLIMGHNSLTLNHAEDIVFIAKNINVPENSDWLMMQYCFEQVFVFVMEKKHRHFSLMMLLIGSRKQAETYIYRLELMKGKRKLVWEATTKSIHEKFESVILNTDCLKLDAKLAEQFYEDDNLKMNVTISEISAVKST